jgi:hypothetical protein
MFLSNENPVAGTILTIAGNYFYDVKDVIFPGGVKATNFVSNDSTVVTVTVPSGVTKAGALQIVGTYGTDTTIAPFNTVGAPSTGFLANFEDGDPYNGWGYWNGTQTNAGFPNNTGKFIQLKPPTLNPGDNVWYSGNNRGVMVNEGQWIASSAQDQIGNYALKFELFVPATAPWTNGSFWITVDPNNSDYTVRYAPWESAPGGKFTTDGWQTITIPLNNFLTNNGFRTDTKKPSLAPANIAALTGGAYKATLDILLMNDSEDPLTGFNVAVDNVRIVKYK